jgi:hypothetical protein
LRDSTTPEEEKAGRATLEDDRTRWRFPVPVACEPARRIEQQNLRRLIEQQNLQLI